MIHGGETTGWGSHRVVTGSGRPPPKIMAMPTMVETVRSVMASGRAGRHDCLVCSRPVAADAPQLRMRGGVVVHRACATYDMRRRRVGSDRLGYPRS